ncbi:MAG TPA: phosphate regulon sensor histidine kinase PhoR [Methylophilaceae bacterium]|jgi:two-component system phosphate regulon sensor histidine kinase PhoR
MQDFWWRTLGSFVPLALFSLLIWPVVGGRNALLLLLIWVVAQLLTHLYNLRKLARWVKNPELQSIPNGSGVWEDVYANLYQVLRQHNRSETQLTSALERLQQAASALPDGLVVLNNADQIEWCNRTAELQLGLNSEHDSGQPISYLVRQTDFVAYLSAHNFSEPLKMRSSHNADVMLELQLVPFGENQKLLNCRDITHLEKMETMRRDFIADVSHELRTPLTVVVGFLETLRDIQGAIPDNLRHYFDLMEQQAGRMRRLVEDLLTLSQLESSHGLGQELVVDVPSLINGLLQEAHGLSGGKHHIVIGTVDLQLGLYGNLEELSSAFSNLISNAIRYTPEGGDILIHWGLRNGEAVFAVQDTGLGIDAQHIPRLTERFYRVDRSRSRATGGTGLGLSIVKHILTRHQAKLEIVSELNVGSTFSAVFPAARVKVAMPELMNMVKQA